MKSILCFWLIPFLSFTTQYSTISFVGKWKSTEKKEVGFIDFGADGFVKLQIAGEIMGGKEFTMEGESYSFKYTINDSITPIEVDFLLKNKDTKEERKLLMIAEFFGNDSLKLGSNFDDKRPIEFTEENAIMLKRVLP